MPASEMFDGMSGDVRFHHITPELWVLDARACAHRWIVFHETYSFCLISQIQREAVVEWKYNHRVYHADPGHIMAMQPGELHANRVRTPPGDFIVVQVSESLMKTVARQLGWRFYGLNIKHPHPGSDHPLMLRALRSFRNGLCTTLFGRGPGGGLCTCRLSVDIHRENLTGIVGAFVQNCAENAREVVHPKSGGAQLKRALSYLREHHNEAYCLDSVARAAGCSPYYLAHVFREEMGIRGKQFHDRILVSKACHAMVGAPNLTIEEIADKIGWPGREDAKKTNLIERRFRDTLGVVPSAFRATLREMSASERRRYVKMMSDPPGVLHTRGTS